MPYHKLKSHIEINIQLNTKFYEFKIVYFLHKKERIFNDINITSLEKAPSYDIHIMLNKSQLLFHKIQNKSYRSLKRTFILTIHFFLLNRM